MVLTDNLVHYYSLEGNSNDAVGSANGSDTVIVYNALYGKISQGALFVRLSSSIITTSSADNVGTAASIQCWFKSTATGALQALMSMKNANISFRIELTTDGTIRGYSEDSNHDSTTTVSSSSGYNDGNWHHVVFVRVSINSYILYVDGSQVDTGGGAQSGNHNGSNVQIGGAQSDYYDGSLDECGYWSRALSATEVGQLYNGGAGLAYPLTVVSGPANLKSLDTNVKANIKSYNTNLIANVKSINTNV